MHDQQKFINLLAKTEYCYCKISYFLDTANFVNDVLLFSENVYMTTVSSHQWPRLEHQVSNMNYSTWQKKCINI